MKNSVWITLFCLLQATSIIASNGLAHPDTTLPNQTIQRPVQVILPGFALDTSIISLAKPDPAVYRVVPGWLRAKAAGKPVYVIDGITAKAGQLKGLRASAVASVQVIDRKRATALYGSVAREGVVAITTKAALRPIKQ